MSNGICHLSVVPIRQNPDLVSEMTSQMIFGDTYAVLEDGDDLFQRIRTHYDGYEGWIDKRQGIPATGEETAEWNQDRPWMAAASAMAVGEEGRVVWIPRGSQLGRFSKDWFVLGGQRYEWKGIAVQPCETISESEFVSYALAYEHAPYLWGGRSPWGIDCSGLAQMVYKIFGVKLPRDSSSQIRCGEPVEHLGDTRTGDLLFFHSARDGSSHVGIKLRGGVLHSSASVRLDKVNENGVEHMETGKLTHKLKAIRRVAEVEM